MILNGFLTILNPESLLIILIGVVIGIVFGAMPGLSTTMAVALFLPVTYSMKGYNSFALLMSLYIGAVSGGLVTAILLRIPGTPNSVATVWDGYPMAKKGQAMKALGTGVFFSFLATILSVFALMFISPVLAKLATSFGFYEYFSIAFFSLTLIATMGGKSMLRGLFSGILGFMFALVGIAPIDAAKRFTFGNPSLLGGFNTLPVLIGLFAVSEIINAVQEARKTEKIEITIPSTKGVRGFGFSLGEFKEQVPNFIRSFLIGLGIGILPGIGGGTSNIISYTVAKKQSKHPELFGTGIMDGIVASETANNASIGGSMIPLLSLGIPGDATTAILLGGLTMLGLTPGPLLYQKCGDFVYSIFASLIIASFVMLFLEFYGLRFFVKVLKIPKYILLPIVFLLCVVGAYGNNSRIFDVYAVTIFGIIGYFFKVFDIPAAPFILGFILGPMAETNLRRGLILSEGSLVPFFTHPVSCLFIFIALLSIVYPIIKYFRGRKIVRKIAS